MEGVSIWRYLPCETGGLPNPRFPFDRLRTCFAKTVMLPSRHSAAQNDGSLPGLLLATRKRGITG